MVNDVTYWDTDPKRAGSDSKELGKAVLAREERTAGGCRTRTGWRLDSPDRRHGARMPPLRLGVSTPAVLIHSSRPALFLGEHRPRVTTTLRSLMLINTSERVAMRMSSH